MIFSFTQINYFFVLLYKSEGFTIQIIEKLKIAVFTWSGYAPSEAFRERTIQSLEALRSFNMVNRIVLDAKDHSLVDKDDIDHSVNSTIEYLGIARGNYRMAVLPPIDLKAKDAFTSYVEALNKALKKRFVVKQISELKEAFSWLMKSKTWFIS